MDLKLPRFESGALGGIKDRLGLANSGSRNDDYDQGYEDYGEYAYDESQDDDYRGYADDDYAPQKPANRGFSSSLPRLVTADDVRAHTHYTPPAVDEAPRTSYERDTYTMPRYTINHTDDQNKDHGRFDMDGMQLDEQHSAGLQSLFTPTTAASDDTSRSARATVSTERSAAAKEPVVTSRHARIMTVVKPESYEDAERISKIVRTGDVAVLSLRNVPEHLSKRILDFSFGVACALDAHVDCPSNSVFVITRGAGLSEDEEARLRGQGLM